MPRFVLLEHTGHPDDPAGRHFDLLLEEVDTCRTWRLAEIPRADGPPVAVTPLPAHRLVWLERLEGGVSGGRGFARRVDVGTYEVLSGQPDSEPVVVRLHGQTVRGLLTIAAVSARLQSGPSGR